MGLFRLLRGNEGPSTRQEAEAAINRAKADIEVVEGRSGIVNRVYDDIVQARSIDVFGPPLAYSFQRKNTDAER